MKCCVELNNTKAVLKSEAKSCYTFNFKILRLDKKTTHKTESRENFCSVF